MVKENVRRWVKEKVNKNNEQNVRGKETKHGTPATAAKFERQDYTRNNSTEMISQILKTKLCKCQYMMG